LRVRSKRCKFVNTYNFIPHTLVLRPNRLVGGSWGGAEGKLYSNQNGAQNARSLLKECVV